MDTSELNSLDEFGISSVPFDRTIPCSGPTGLPCTVQDTAVSGSHVHIKHTEVSGGVKCGIFTSRGVSLMAKQGPEKNVPW